jgi:hypothetical protein
VRAYNGTAGPDADALPRADAKALYLCAQQALPRWGRISGPLQQNFR